MIDPIEPVVISITKINVGESANVISDKCKLLGTVRTFTLEALDQIEENMRQICESLPKIFGGNIFFNFQRQYPPTINHNEQTEIAANVAEKIVGKDNIQRKVKPSMGAEDFSFMLQKCPGSYFFLGNGNSFDGHFKQENSIGSACMLHNSKYDFNDALIGLGAQFWVRLIQARIGEAIDD
jgi:hippurate hydrolase